MDQFKRGQVCRFKRYEDDFDGELIAQEPVILFDLDGTDALRVHPIRNGRADARIAETVFGGELQPLPPVFPIA